MAKGLWLKSSMVPLPELGLTGVVWLQEKQSPLQLGAMVYRLGMMPSSTNQATVPLILTLNMT